MRTLIVIPARYASKRFPGKPLADIAGKTLLQRVVEVARAACSQHSDCRFIVATDDVRIAAHAEAIAAPVVMTDPDLPSGTDRAYAAALSLSDKPDFVLNLQGDAPLTPPRLIGDLIEAALQVDADVYTPVTQLSWDTLDEMRLQKQQTPFSGTSCLRAQNGTALWFSKTIIPAMRKEATLRAQSAHSPVYRHIGLYGYRLAALKRFTELAEGHYEALEGLEQLRFLENGLSIHTIAVTLPAASSWGVDTPQDADRVARLLKDSSTL